MRKIGLCFCLIALLILSAAVPVSACWAQPLPFEILSEDGSRVFVFDPDQYGMGIANAAVYEIINGERQLVYTVEDLASFAYESNFHFSTDMAHFIRTFPAPGIPVFEVFSYGERTRIVLRSDFIEDYSEAGRFTSIGPEYNVGWQIEERSPNGVAITISTGEGNTFVFDITTAEFIGDDLPSWVQNPSSDIPSSWAQDSVERAGELGLLPDPFRSGFERNATRAQFAAIAVALYEHIREPITGRTTFTDTTDPNVEKAAYLGIVSGVGDNRFDPNAPLTREQAAVMLSRLMGSIGGIVYALLDSPAFYDMDEVSEWAVSSVFYMQTTGMMSGIGSNRFAPQQPYTIEQSVVTIMSLYDLVKIGKQTSIANQFSVHYVRTSWYEGKSGVTVITSVDELNRHFANSTDWLGNDFIHQYTAEFFNKNYLVIVALTENSGSNRHRVDMVDENGDIVITRLLPEIGTMDMAGWDIIIELDNSFKPGRFNVVFIDESV